METADPRRLWDAFRHGGAAFSALPAIRTAQGELTFAELFVAAARVAEALRRAGLPEGSYVIFGAPNSAAFLPVVLGLWKMSATVGLMSPMDGASELQAVADKAPPFAHVVAEALAERWGAILDARVVALDADIAGERFALLLTAATRATNPHPDAALIKFTSGSTGEPKGVALTPANVLAEAASVVGTLGLTPDDTILAPVPLCHSYGFDLGGLAMLQSGASLMLPDAFIGRRVISDLADGRGSVFLGVPAMFRLMVDVPDRHVRDLSAARYLLSCTAPLSPALIAAFHARFGAVICQHYGSSEAGAVTTHIPARVLDKPDSVGRPMGGVALRVVDPNGRELAPGTEGEVVVQSPAVGERYVMGAAEDRPLGNGTVSMGDSGRLDADGFLYLTGRLDQMINVGGFKVSPLEVVQALELYAPIKEAAVTGVRDRQGEEVIYAAVTLRRPATETEILAFCRSQVAEYKVPRRVDIRDELPRAASGKVRLRPEDVHL
jgi:acyl-CoA synthetase (AMP-forming)/AMP-acid ligase II